MYYIVSGQPLSNIFYRALYTMAYTQVSLHIIVVGIIFVICEVDTLLIVQNVLVNINIKCVKCQAIELFSLIRICNAAMNYSFVLYNVMMREH